jgi:threonine-phosphate decarboxylase
MEIRFDRSHGGAHASDSLIDFSVSTNPFGPPPEVLEAYHKASATIASYPEPYAATLTGAIAGHLGVMPGNVLAGNGSIQLIYLIARVLRPKRPFIVIPTFSEIANSLLILGATPASIRLRRERDFQLDTRDIDDVLAHGADALFLGRPNSPTGSMLDLVDVAAIAGRCAHHRCWCVIDEAFIEFADEPTSAVVLVKQYPRLIVIRSMTKLYAIPGLRLGYMVGSSEIVAELGRALEPWSVSGPAAAVGLACLAQPDRWRDEIRNTLRVERTYLEQQLGMLPEFTVFPSKANFLMFEVSRPEAFTLHLLQHGIMVRDLASLPGAGPGLFRIAVRSRADNDRLIEAARTYR